MPLESGHKVTIWSIEDKGTYSKASLSGQKKDKNGQYQTDWSNPFCTLYGKAYEAVKGIEFTKEENKHISARIGWGYEIEKPDGKKYRKAPFSVTNNYDKVKKINYTNYAIWDITLLNSKSNADDEEESGEVVEGTGNTDENVTPQETPSQNIGNGLVGLDFLNIPDGFGDNSSLPFR